MNVRARLLSLSAAACVAALVPRAASSFQAPPPAAAPLADTPTADTIFGRAKAAWRGRTDVPFVTYGLRERYTWRNRVHDNWWQGYYRSADDALVLRRIIVAEDEAARMRGTSIAINYRIHNGSAHVDSLETNADADAFPILDPLVDPDASFGLARGVTQHVTLDDPAPFDAPPSPRPSPTPFRAMPRLAFLGQASPSPGTTPLPGATDRPLRELARVEAVTRDYAILLVGTERVRDVDAYHLSLTPLREPRRYRLRDLWIATADYATLKLSMAGLFDGKPYDAALWTVTYVQLAGRPYVQQIKTDETLRFGLDRYVSGLEYDFVGYQFPAPIDPLEFGSVR